MHTAAMLLAISTMSACGGGGGGSAPVVTPPPPAPTYTLGGSIAGLKSGGMILSAGADRLSIPAAASTFTFATGLATGASYSIGIAAQPPRFTQRCTVANGTGTVGSANATSAAIACVDHLALVSTLAGTNNPGRQPIGPEAMFNRPQGLVTDEGGNVYVADRSNNRIARVTPDGAVTTVTGRTPGQAATQADLAIGAPEAITRDKEGNLYTVGNHMVRKVSRDGQVTVLAGADVIGYADGAGAAARFNTPLGITIDGAGNLYVADTLNLRIRKITPAGVVTTVAGSGARGMADGAAMQASFNDPYGVAVDRTGNLFVADKMNNLLRKITAEGVVSTFAGQTSGNDTGDGQGTQATFKLPQGIAIDDNGLLYVAEDAGKIRTVTSAGWVSTVAGSYANRGNTDGPGTVATFQTPWGIAIDASGNLYVGDRDAGRVRKIVEQ